MDITFALSTVNGGNLRRTTNELAIVRYISGEEPCARFLSMRGGPPPADRLPDGASIERELAHRTSLIRIVAGDGWTATVAHDESAQQVDIQVSARTRNLASTIVDALARTVPEPKPQAGAVEADLWFPGRKNVSRRRRNVDCPPWPEIEANYPGPIKPLLSALMDLRPPENSGRLILWHGEPGTGKTTAIRALARHWSAWAKAHYVMDAERFFEEPEYMLGVLVDEDELVGPSAPEWKLLIVEDADQFLVADARKTAGAGLGRLLNLTDGIVGQGLKVLVLITTNEPIGKLHPAVVRPGRCLAKLEFPRFSPTECRDWLGGDEGLLHGGATLAELYEIRGQTSRLCNELADANAGLYL